MAQYTAENNYRSALTTITVNNPQFYRCLYSVKSERSTTQTHTAMQD